MLAYNATKAQIFTSDFETWTGNVPANWAVATTVSNLEADSVIPYATSVHSGDSACRLVNRQGTSSHKRFTTQAVSVTSGTTYAINFWVRGHGSIRTALYSGSAYGTYNAWINVNSTSWALQTQSVTATTTSSTAQFIFSIASTFADMDDIQIDDVTIGVAVIDTVSIHDIQYTTAIPANSPYNNQTVYTGGIVTAKYKSGYFIQNGSGSWNGLFVYDATNAASVTRGDSVIIKGIVTEYNNLTEMKTITSFTKVNSGNAEPAPYVVTGANSNNEEFESVLVTILNANCLTTADTNGVWLVYDTDTTYIDSLIYIYSPVIGTTYDITGVNYYIKGAYSYVSGKLAIEPRDVNDISIHTGINEIENDNINIYPNPVSDILYVNNLIGTEKIQIINILGETIKDVKASGTKETINVSDLSKGIYILNINNNGRNLSKKISIE